MISPSSKIMVTFILVLFLASLTPGVCFTNGEKWFKIKSSASVEFSEYCLQLNETDSSIIINTCSEGNRNQIWNVDDHSRIHNEMPSQRSGCIYTSNSSKALTYEATCSSPLSGLNKKYAKFSYNLFDTKLINGYKAMQIAGKPADGAKVIMTKPKPPRLTQRWILDFIPIPEQLKLIDNPPPLPLALCSGDCDHDSDCEGDLRCAQRTMKNNRQNVPGCVWGDESDSERYLDKDYCFAPSDVSKDKIINYIGECGSHGNEYKCGECEGSCYNDWDCNGDLQCMHREGFEAVPGCIGESGKLDMYGKNICYDPKLPEVKLDSTNCTETNTCEICSTCISDDDCEGDLRCAVRDEGSTVPGCSISQFTIPSIESSENICFRPLSFPGNGGVINYVGECNPLTYLCNRCEAGCTSDEDCVGDLVCQKRTGFEPVPGCFHEGGPYDMKSKGVCYDGSLKPELLYYGHHCKDYHPHPYKCPLCGGGCENDHDCKGDLRCAKRDGLENVPGCAWGLNSTLHQYLGDISYCFDPFVGNPVANNVVRYIGECSPYIPGYLCGECQGGCKTDSDCQFGLKCLHRSGAVGDGFHDVPGCKDEGGERDVWGKGICYDPAKFPIV